MKTEIDLKKKIYYQVMYRLSIDSSNRCTLAICLGLYEDIRDAVTRIVSLHRENSHYLGQIGIIKTTILDKKYLVKSTYQD